MGVEAFKKKETAKQAATNAAAKKNPALSEPKSMAPIEGKHKRQQSRTLKKRREKM